MYSRFKIHIIFLFLVIIGISDFAYAQLGSFENRKKYFVESDSISGSTDLTNFPVLINITDSDFAFNASPTIGTNNSNGFDIAFSAADGTTALDFELESYNSGTGEIIFWVRFPTLSPTADTQFFIYYGDASITTDQSSSSTWDSDYQLVMHMDDVSDATSNANDGTNNGTVSATGIIGNGRDFDRGAGDFISVADDATLDITGEITISFWYNPESTAAPDMVTKGTNESYEAQLRGGPRLRFSKNGGSNLNASAAFNLSLLTWYYLTYVQSSSGRTIYQNGELVNSDANTTAFATNANALQISRSADAVDGIMDEVRISNTDRSEDWIITEYNNQLNPDTFIQELDDMPSLSNIESTAQLYTAGGSDVNITTSLTVDSHPTISEFTSATIEITGNLDNPDDQLNFVDQLGITGSYVASTGILTLSGTTTLANYQAAIRSVTYSSNELVSPSGLTRTISITGFNGSDATNTITRDLDIITTLTDLTTDISDNVFHFDARDIDGDGIDNTPDGTAVSTWVDLGTNSFDFTTGNAATFDLEGFGERGSIIFDGAADELIKGAETDINNSSFTQKTFAIAFRTGDDISGFQVIYEQANGTRGYNFTISNGNLYAQAYSRGDANWGASNAVRHRAIDLGTVSTNSIYFLIAYHNSNIWAAKINEGSVSSVTNAAEMPAVNETVALGGNSANTRQPITLTSTGGNFNGEIVEFASWNTVLNNGQIASLIAYFDDKWGNTAPVLSTIEGTAIDFTEGDPDTAITSTILVTDSDTHLNLDSAKVAITANYVNGEDVLTFSNTANITGNFNATTGELLLTGSDTISNYQDALRAVRYNNSTVNPTVSTRTIEFEIYDWNDVSNTLSRNINVIDVALTPELDNIEGTNISYTEGDGETTITSTITVSDADDTDMESATISITSNYTLGEDFLRFTDTGTITGNFASGTGILTLSGTDTEANYQAALRSVSYENTSSDPIEMTRTVSFVVNDGDNNSNTVSRDIDVSATNSPPEFSSLESSVLTYPLEAVNITNTLTVYDPDDTSIDSAVVLITGNFQSDEDSLFYSTIFGIIGNYNASTGKLLLQGNSSFSDYQTALRSVEYFNYADIPTGPERTISFLAYDDEAAESDTAKRVIDVSAVESISGLELWLRSDVGVDTTAGGEVTTWEDQSGNNRDFTGVADAGIRPTISASNTEFGGEPAVSFVGDGDYFEDTDGHTGYINGLTEFTLFLVYKADGTNSDRGLWIADTPSGADEIFTIRYDASGANTGGSFTNVVKTGIRGNSAANQLESFSDIQSTDAQITSLHWEDGVTYDLYVDGILNNPSAAGSPPTGAIANATTVIVGKGGKDDPDAANRSWDGLIAEVILYSRSLTDEERESIEDYLSVKFSSAIRKITEATGGESISADDANGAFTSLTGPIIQEGFAGELTNPGTIVLTLPSGYKWDTGVSPGVTVDPAYGGSTTLTASFNSFSADSTTVTFDIDSESTGNPGQITFSGLEVRPNTGIIPNSGNISNTGSTGQGGGTNYGTLGMVAGAADSLTIIEQPTATNVDSTITPSVRVQLVDQFGNELETSGTDITISLSSGTGTLSGTTTVATNVLGIAEFSDLSIDDVGTKELTASGTGLDSEVSSSFDIVNAGTLTGFTIERVPSGSISAKTAGQTFDIIITAIDGTATTVTTFNGTVVISSSCTMGTGQGTTASFTNGVLASTTVSITSVGVCDITATNSAGAEFGTSNGFNVTAGAASEVTSTITASPTVILNNGITTSTITVALKDVYGNELTTGGDAVTLTITPTALGSLGIVTDVGDGTYTATLTSSTTAGTDNITGTVNAASITDDTDVEYALFSHIWDSQLGSASDASNWEDAANWNVGSQPGASSVVFIPASPSVGNEQPVIDVAGSTVTSVTMETGASLTISGGINFTITGDLSGGSVLGTNADSLTVGGDVLDVSTINVGTVILNGSTAQSITDPHSYTNLVIDNASGISVEENLIISDSLKLENGELLIPTGANLVAEGISYGSGSLRFQRAITGDIGWRMLSAPVSSTFGDFLDGVLTQGYDGAFYDINSSPGDTLQPNVIYYIESYDDSGNGATDNQRFRAPTSAQSLTAGQGIFVFFFGDIAADSRYNDPLPDTLDVSGQEFGLSGEVDFGITYTTTADSGWNLVGNPFGATIDWDDNSNWTKTNVDGTIYVWDPAANGGDGEYLTWNGSTGTLGSGLIAPFQGFWVKANAASPDLTVTTDAKTTGGAFLRKENTSPEEHPMFELELSIDDLEKKTSLFFTDEGSMGKDVLDGFTLLPFTDNRLDLHTLLEDGSSLAINHLPTLSDNRIITPLVISGYREGIPISGEYLLRFTNADNLPEEWIVLLIDKETGNEVNLITNEEQRIFHTTRGKAKVGNPLSSPDLVFLESLSTRFTLMITTEEIEANIPRSIFLEQNYPNPFNPSTTIPFGLNEASNVQLEVYDILGRKIQTLVNDILNPGNYTINFDASALASGVYLYRLTTDNKTLVKRFTLIK